MNRETKSVVKEYADTLSDAELHHLYSRMRENLSGDFPEAINIMSKSRTMDSLFVSAKSVDDFFELCDDIEDILRQICRSRGLLGSLRAQEVA